MSSINNSPDKKQKSSETIEKSTTDYSQIKLKGKIKIIDRPLLDVTNHEAIQKELEFRKEFRKKNEDI